MVVRTPASPRDLAKGTQNSNRMEKEGCRGRRRKLLGSVTIYGEGASDEEVGRQPWLRVEDGHRPSWWRWRSNKKEHSKKMDPL